MVDFEGWIFKISRTSGLCPNKGDIYKVALLCYLARVINT